MTRKEERVVRIKGERNEKGNKKIQRTKLKRKRAEKEEWTQRDGKGKNGRDGKG